MSYNFRDEVVEEGLNILYKNLGAVKATKFLQILTIPKSDSVKDIEGITEGMNKETVLSLIAKTKENNKELWEKMGLL
ncbi:hypothetical protein A2230_05785 [candidate division WOR-1 bacterium RIFOXYA2_FULL_36_21]|uniref:Uncharacterized protein n=1 Tax=candidate division WOR-1 bacterium RIFOXYB2_FULL_36_35 TaxID=1802578 RepID=A0A1F4S8V8_UNCSA|nr:MAG: hypothetical protein A2230_05785 [candidate division WOR-1 bacterium RIFOXYA2_FULL_36_21]OGC16866.1 MAG: hypothetical protein A2290_05070 [candidate division WOR-1 bacterium RIFOXYB2_FULL_36_35]OGC18667.1 MAG: hypothetical protein A2282_07140 [candidate division WOR-1 bacterium RIFOXYA12_FULL_36_13]